MEKRKPVILIAEDDPDDCLLLGDAFGECRKEMRLDYVADGQEVMDYLHKRIDDGLPDLIILDIRMPRKDGFETLEGIKTDERLRQIPVIVLSGFCSSENIERCYELGANTVIIKPDSFSELSRAIRGIYNYWFTIPKG